MWVGVDKGLAGIKLSGSRNNCGLNKEINIIIIINKISPIRSFDE
jgi:hypothetical protein